MGSAAAITLVGIPAIPALSLDLTDGLVLSAGNNGTGPGADGGTVNFAAGTPPIAITEAPVNIFYNPVAYTSPTDHSGGTFFTLVGGLSTVTQYMLVFPDGADKTYDGTTVATFTGLKGDPAGVTLAGAGTANFDTADVGDNKTVNFTGFTLTQDPILAGGTAINYAFANSCCGPAVGKTTASILPALPVIPPVPPTGTSDIAPEEMMGPAAILGTTPAWFPTVVSTATPPQLLSLAPPPAPPPPVVVPEEVPPPPVVIPEEVPPVPPRKQDRN
jgi:hypothetical protein